MTQQTNTLDASIRVHDEAFYNWIGTLLVDYGDIAGATRNAFPVLRVFSAPHQSFAKVTELMVVTGFVPGADDAARRANAEKLPQFPVPFVTLERGEPKPDPEQAGNAKTFRRIELDRATGRWNAYPWPRHYRTTYRATFWSKTRMTETFVREWVYSQMGPKGVGQRERLIPVVHPLPWGTQTQQLRFEASRDLSDLEGEDQRMLRVEYEFTLRTLIFLPSTPAGPITYGVGFDEATLSMETGDTNPVSETVTQVGHTDARSANLFFFPYEGPDVARLWPVAGEGAEAVASTLAPGAGGLGVKDGSLDVAVTDSDDSVELLERVNRLDNDNKVIVGVSFSYLGRLGESALNMRSVPTDGGAGDQRFQRLLPATNGWAPVHLFMLSDQTTTVLEVIGTGDDAELTLHDIDVRFEYNGTRTAFQASSVDGGDTLYQWSAMGKRPYLVVGKLHPVTDATVYPVTAQDDPVSPAWSQTQQISPDTSIGFVFLVQPKAGGILVRVPTSLQVDSLYAQPYDGPYNGNSV